MSIPDAVHTGCVKVGDATITSDDINALRPNCKVLNEAAKLRINEYTRTAAVEYRLLYTELLVFIQDGKQKGLRDHDVHNILKRSGVKQPDFHIDNQGTEWYCCDVQTVVNAIKAAKEGRTALNADEINVPEFAPDGTVRKPISEEIRFRDEQKEAIAKTIRRFSKGGKQMLWNAKMRFGKTLTTLELIRQQEFHRTLIITHRPAVNDEWETEFKKIFVAPTNWKYGSRKIGHTYASLEADAKKDAHKHYIYFASIQDLRGSELAGGKIDKNSQEFHTDWDLLVIDEAHEGTQTELGQNVIDAIVKPNTRVLSLSGTPFNLLDDYEQDDIFTWDYVMEQMAKRQWDIDHFGDPNPYGDLPALNIYTFDLGKLLNEDENYIDIEDKAFNFREFFRVQDGKFIHEADVKAFLDLIVKLDSDSCFPFSSLEFRKYFRHSLWMVPGVKEAKALSELLQKHPVFRKFNIANVAGEGDDDMPYDDAKKLVLDAIGEDPESTYSITLSCGRLTTGVTIKPWTAVFMLAGSYSTDAKAYMQTIFRVQSPWHYNGKQKEQCYVFDFAPDRTLKVIAETAKVSAKAGKTTPDDRIIMGEFLNFCPVIGYNGTQMRTYDANTLLEQLKRAYIDRVIRRGFDDVNIYNDRLLQITPEEKKRFDALKRIIGTTKSMHKTGQIDMAKNGLTDEEYAEKERIEKKPKNKRTKEEEEFLKKVKEQREQKAALISILRGISIRIPLLVYGAELKDGEEITIANLPDLVDDVSWVEFMPKDVTKDLYREFVKYYDEDVIRAAARQIRSMAKAADKLTPTERVQQIALIFSYFHNPDKETVLTPWRVVNMHIGDCLGGYDFYDETHEKALVEPRLISYPNVTNDVFANIDTRILEINSKTGLYPLYMAYSVYRYARQRFVDANMLARDLTLEEELNIWDEVVANNIFVICKTKMARSITERTLVGFRGAQTRMHAFDDLLNQVQNKKETFIKQISRPAFWNIKNNTQMLKFNAIVGNPPYQLTGASGGNNDAPIFQVFSMLANNLTTSYASLIEPSRWFAAGRENLLGDYRSHMLTCGNIEKITAFADGRDVFPHVEIKGGICYYLANKGHNGQCLYTLIQDDQVESKMIDLSEFDILIRDPKLAEIVRAVLAKANEDNVKFVDSLISNDTPFGIPSNPRKSSKTPFNVYTKRTPQHDVLLYHIENQKRKVEYAALSDIRKNVQAIDLPKVFIPGAGGSGNDDYILGKPEYAPTHSVCSQSYLYAAFDSDDEAKNFVKYVQTKFLRILVSVMKITQSAPQRAYRFVPMQNFTNNSNIDWSKTTAEIDKQLYHLYGLDKINGAVEYIESKLRYI